MADDGNAKAESETAAPEPAARVTEWTASDARGPLNAAGESVPIEPDAGPTHHPTIPEPVGAADESVVPGERQYAPADAPAASHDAPAMAAAQPRRSPWPIAAGIIVGAIIGAGSAAAYYATYATRDGNASQLSALSARLDAIQNRPDPRPDIAALKSSVADLGGRVAVVQKTADAAARTQQGAPQPAQKEAAKPDFDPGPLRQKIVGLQSDIDALRKQGADVKAVDAKVAALAATIAALNGVEGKVAALQSSIDGIQKQSSTAQASIETLRSNQKVLEGKVTSSPALAVVADSLVTQIMRGEPYANQVEALASIGADPATVAVLKENADKGVPSSKVLAAKFEPLADPIVATEQHTAPGAGFLDKLKSGMFGMVSVRRVDDTTGDTLASRVALIQADLAHDDVADAYRVWSALPAAARTRSDAWGALAKTHVEAMQAARALQTQAIAALGAKKS